MVIEMEEREIVKISNDRNPIHLTHRDFWRNNFSHELLNRYGKSTYGDRRVTNEMIDDDEFWSQFKKSSSFRTLKRQTRYQFIHYSLRKDAYDVVRKNALGITESNPTV